MNLSPTTTSSGSYKSSYQQPADLSLDISTKFDSKTYDGTVKLKGGDIKVTTETGESATVPAVSGAPPVVIAMDLLKILSDGQNATPKVSDANAGLHKYDFG